MRKTSRLRLLLRRPRIATLSGVGSALPALLSERHGFDAIWASGLCISAERAVPDASILTMTEFLAAARAIDEATSLPVVADCDTGFGDVANVARMVRQYERAGIAAVTIEDKEFPKRNSFAGSPQRLVDTQAFAAKIRAAKWAQDDPDFIVVARLESFVVGDTLPEALERAWRYAEAGADALLVHSKAKTGDEVLAFARAWHADGQTTPLLVVPTTYYTVTEDELEAEGISAVIYANHALRASLVATNAVLAALRASRSPASIEEQLMPVAELLSLIGTDELEKMERRFATGEAVDEALTTAADPQ